MASNFMDEFDRQIIKELIKSYDDFVWYFKLNIKRPLIELSEVKSRWGSWDPLLRVLCISRRLVQEYSWNVVLEILKHEMAHQMVSDVFGDVSDNSHGASFQKACDTLRILPWARLATGGIVNLASDPMARFKLQMNVDEQRSLERIHKLMDLSKSSNSFEAELAMKRVKELTLQHERQFSHQTTENYNLKSGFDVFTLNLNSQRIQPFESRILSLLGDHFKVKVVISTTFDPLRLRHLKVAELIGKKQRLIVADYVFEFLRRTAMSLWDYQKVQEKLDSRLKRSFLIGVIVGVDLKLKDSQIVESKSVIHKNSLLYKDGIAENLLSTLISEQAIEKKHQQELEDFSSYVFPRMRRNTRTESRVNHSAFNAGVSQGKRISIHPGVSASSRIMSFLGK